MILLIEEILHHLGCIKSCNSDSGIVYHITWSGFLPSVCLYFPVDVLQKNVHPPKEPFERGCDIPNEYPLYKFIWGWFPSGPHPKGTLPFSLWKKMSGWPWLCSKNTAGYTTRELEQAMYLCSWFTNHKIYRCLIRGWAPTSYRWNYDPYK